MGENKSGRKTLWMYAVILFTSAFIVLLLTAYSQIKFSKNINEYKSQLSNEEKAKNNFQTNLNSAIQDNIKLNEELNNLKKELDRKELQLNENKKLLDEQSEKILSLQREYEDLMSAQKEFDKGNVIESADILKNKVDSQFFGESTKERYNYLREKTFPAAAGQLYREGYGEYMRRNYEAAIFKLNLSVSLSDKEYFSDDCIYFAAYSEYRLGNNSNALMYFEKIMNDYPESNHINEVSGLIKQLKQ